jgi:hypothetical protein
MTPKATALLATLKALYGARDEITTDAATKLIDILERAPDEALEAIVRERVKFCRYPAARILQERAEIKGMQEAARKDSPC